MSTDRNAIGGSEIVCLRSCRQCLDIRDGVCFASSPVTDSSLFIHIFGDFDGDVRSDEDSKIGGQEIK